MASQFAEESLKATNTRLRKQVRSLQDSHLKIMAENRGLKQRLKNIEGDKYVLISKELYNHIQQLVGKFLRWQENK